jgi:hypothetical protein
VADANDRRVVAHSADHNPMEASTALATKRLSASSKVRAMGPSNPQGKSWGLASLVTYPTGLRYDSFGFRRSMHT